jgi:hypothetical protein
MAHPILFLNRARVAAALSAHLGWFAALAFGIGTLQQIRVAGTAPGSSDAHADRLNLTALPVPALTIHVSPSGSDAASGTSEHPLATLQAARNQIQSLRRQGGLPRGGVEVLVHGGEYTVDQTFTLGKDDSGTETAPVVFRAAHGEKPVFRGGVRLHGWQALQDPAAAKLIPESAHAHVWQCDLKACGVTQLLPLELGGFASGRGFGTHPAHELFFNGKAMQLARGPNEGFLHIADVAVKDGTKGYDRQGSKVGQFFYDGDRPSRWRDEPDLLLYGYWFWDWADSYERVAKIDPDRRMITLAEPWHTYGYSVGAPFYAINALSELDAPGEWYLDRRSARVFFYAPSDPGMATVELSVLAVPMLELRSASYMRFEGMTWELGSADGIVVRGATNCLFAGCTVRRFAGNGIEILGGHGDGLLSCDIYSMGRGGAIISGGERKTLTPSGHFVENCDIYDLSRIDHTYTPALLVEGVGHRVAHNRLHDVLSSAMRVEGNDHQIEYNEIFNAVMESDDQGGADMFGNPTYRGNVYRFNYWHQIGKWRATDQQPKCGQAAIRLDDAICGTLVYGNIFEQCSAGKLGFGAVQIHGGKDNVIENNLFIDCAAALSFTPWAEKRWTEYIQKYQRDPSIDHALYLARYPELARLGDSPNTNHVRRNVTLRCGQLLRRAPKAIEQTGNLELTQGEFNPKDDSPILHQAGFERIPVEEIGLYRDAWRSKQ